MFSDSTIAGSWPALAARLDAADAMAWWGRAEPSLVAAGTVTRLPTMLRGDADPARADELLGCLVRLAAADGGDDADAVLVLLHLLSEGAVALAARLRDLAMDMLPLVVGELTLQIRGFPWQRRTRAFAASLLLDTRAALWRELRPHGTRTYRQVGEVMVDPTDPVLVGELLDVTVTGPGDNPELELLDVLVWAERSGVAPRADLVLLLEVIRAKDHGGDAQRRVAEAWGIDERTLRRRRDRALAVLHAASPAYLRACA